MTVGGVQTNHGRLTAAAAAKAGLACTLVLTARGRKKLSGNLLLDCLLGASLVYTDGRSTSAVIEETLGCAAGRGQSALFHPGGRQQRRGQRRVLCHGARAAGTGGQPAGSPARLVCTMGSLGTFAGCGWEPEPSARRFPSRAWR